MAKHTAYHLTARQDFGAYRRGDHIEEAAEVDRILGGEHAAHVVKVPVDPEPEMQSVALDEFHNPTGVQLQPSEAPPARDMPRARVAKDPL